MKTQFTKWMKIVNVLLAIFMICSFLFFIIGEVCLPVENGSGESTFTVFEADWMRVLPDGTAVEFSVPGSCETECGEWMSIYTKLPENQKNTTICVRSMQQELRIYVGDELRKEYSTLDIQPVGKTSTMTYVLTDLYERDGGKILRIDAMTESFHSGYISEIYEGMESDIIKHFYGMYAPSLIVATLMFLIGVIVVGSGVCIQYFYKRNMDLLHLGNVILITSTWLMVESKIRQFVFPNSTAAMLMGFLMIALLPYPFVFYVNSVQKGRYQKAYFMLGVATSLNFVITILLQFLGIRDFYEIMQSSHIIILVLILLMGITIVRDVIKGYAKEYKEVAVGFAVLMAAGICEIGLVYVVDSRINGIALCIGLATLLFMAGLKSIRDLLAVEKEKQMAIAATESKAKFLANMSHEIRTPLNTILGMNEMILRENENDSIEEYAHNIKSASHMLMGLINDVLDFSKIEAGKMQIVENEYDLASMIKDVYVSAEIRANQKNLEMKHDIDRSLPAILKGDEIRIKQILNNLLSNAVKYTDQGSITLTVKGNRDDYGFSLLISVEDTGKGIKEEDMKKLFSSFQRLDLVENRYIEGTGLGLTITKQLVDEMHGTIDVRSKYGVGSCFWVRIPQTIVKDIAIQTITEDQASVKKKEAAKKEVLCIPGAKILAVDDTHTNLIVIKGLLKHSQIEVDLASGGHECLQMTKQKKYDLIFMDHMMPQPDGIETLHMIKDDAENENLDTPIIVLTANAIAGMKEQYIEEGFTDYLSKPIEVEQLEEMLKKYLLPS